MEQRGINCVRSRLRRSIVLVVLCLTLGAVPVCAQQTATESAAAAPAPARPLVLDVVVHIHAGKPVSDLRAEDFVVLDNKRPQKALSFKAVGSEAETRSSAEPSAEIVLVVDEVNTNFDRVAYERDQIKRFAMQNDGKLAHPVSIVFFTDHGSEVSHGSTRDGRTKYGSRSR